MTKLTVAFSNDANVPKKHRLEKKIGKEYDIGSKIITKFTRSVTVGQ
jgi:hypothetical protein